MSVESATVTAEAVLVDIGRGSVRALALGLPLLATLSGLAFYATLGADTGTKIIGYFFALFFAAPVLIALSALPKLTANRGLAFDARGVRYWQGKSETLIKWQDIAAIGIGYEQPPELPALFIEDAIKSKILDQIVDKRRRLAVEIFPTSDAVMQGRPLLARYRFEQAPPAPGLAQVRWRLPLPPLSRLAADVAKGMETFQSSRWLGWFARPWRGGL